MKSINIILFTYIANFQIPHPSNNEELLYFIFDQPHLCKNLRSGFLKYRFEVSRSIADKLKMVGIAVDGYRYLMNVVEHDKKSVNQLCPSLKESFVNLKGSHFSKMRVPHALQVIYVSSIFI
jgi:beta-galactosidase/beta-glucuronidase